MSGGRFLRALGCILSLLLVLLHTANSLGLVPGIAQLGHSGTERATYLHEKIVQWSSEHSGIILIDGDNVRGKTKFSVDKERLCEDVERWSEAAGVRGRVGIVFDHAQRHQAFVLPSGLCVVFAGPRKSADDVLSRDVRWVQGNLGVGVMVITEDLLLRRRCRTNAQSSRLSQKKAKKGAQKQKKQAQAQMGEIDADSLLFLQSGGSQGSLSKGSKSSPEIPPPLDLSLISSPLFVEMLYGSAPIPISAPPDAQQAQVQGGALVSERERWDQWELLQAEVELRLQLDVLRAKLACRTTPRKSAAQLRQRALLLGQKLQALVDRAQPTGAVLAGAGVEMVVGAQGAQRSGGGFGTSRSDSADGEDLDLELGGDLGGDPSGDLGEVDGDLDLGEKESFLAAMLALNAPPYGSAVARGVGTIQQALAQAPRRGPEDTWERVVMAEQMRLNFAHGQGVGVGAESPGGELLRRYAAYVNQHAQQVDYSHTFETSLN
ncbi:hypothetical protein B484DRAFT_443407 [Ochromonadaceae sp. CCMP2298]|nr:hypothetical protein B484DRAFT_443407 [Ochromonadaceae sp. CCMP2298]